MEFCNFEVLESFIKLIIVVVGGIWAIKKLTRQNWGKNVSSSRNKWLDNFRDEASTIVANVELIKKAGNYSFNYYYYCYFDCDLIFNAEKAKATLLMRLNTSKYGGNEYNFELQKMLENLDFTRSSINDFDTDRFIKVVKKIAEQEWEKVKREAKGKK